MSSSAAAGVDGASKADAIAPYDGLLLVSFGGPEAPDEVMPFLRRVTAGRNIPDERLETVAEHYLHFGGRSPINDQNRELVAALEADLKRRDLDLPVLWGNRNSDPFLADALRSATERGLHRLVVVTTSAYSCYSSCRQYRENLADALAEVQLEGLLVEIDKIGPYAGRPAFVQANTRLVVEALRSRTEIADDELAVLFVTHSIPDAMDETSGPGDGEERLYQEQHLAVATAITQTANTSLGRTISPEVVYCSRSGSPAQPWLGPDVNDRIRELAEQGCRLVVVAPIGFVSDHMEVAYDLDTEAAETARDVGVELLRVPTVGVDEEFVAGLVDLVLERAAEARGEHIERGPLARPSVCPPGCCPNLREARPALCGSD